MPAERLTSGAAAAAKPLRKGAKTREILMDAAKVVFVRDGYLNAEISEIARQANKSNGTFYIYFSNKSDLLDALVEQFRQDAAVRFDEAAQHSINQDAKWYDASTPADWHAVVVKMWDAFKLHSPTFYALAQAGLVDERFAKIYRDIRANTRSDFCNYVKARQRQGCCRSINAEHGATALETMIEGCMHEWLMASRKTLDRREEKKRIATLSGIFAAVLSSP